MESIDWKAANEACEALTEEQDDFVRELISHIAEKWTLWTISVLSEAQGPMRFSRLMDAVEGISQKSLTKTLRQLERSGFVTRQVFAEVPPRVEYRITTLGEGLLMQLQPVWQWTMTNIALFEEARKCYTGDTRENPWMQPNEPVAQGKASVA